MRVLLPYLSLSGNTKIYNIFVTHASKSYREKKIAMPQFLSAESQGRERREKMLWEEERKKVK